MFFSDKRLLYVIIAIIVAISLIGYVSNPSQLLDLLFCVPGVLIAITVHEFAHSLAAYTLGDDTAKSQGRLTLNPLKHIDPLGLIMILFFKFGWGKPVQVDGRNIKKKISVRKAEAIIAAAGPITNFIMAFIFVVIFVLVFKSVSVGNAISKEYITITSIIQYAIVINIGLGVFNLIPLPPLDGSKVLKAFLPERANNWLENYEQYFYMIFLILWFSGAASSLTVGLETYIYAGLIHLAVMFV